MAEAAAVVTLQVQRAASLEGPWSKVTEIDVPAVEPGEYFRVGIDPAGKVEVPAHFTRIPAGVFTLGTPDTEANRRTSEGPQTVVRLTEGFWMSRYETTQREWVAVMGTNPSPNSGDPELPMDNVSHQDALEYCSKLTTLERAAGRLPHGLVYRLPTEAEWEYACRAGTTNATFFGDALSSTNANFAGDFPYGGAEKGPSLGRTARVGSYPPNAWGLYDMHGNVWEWCVDWHPSRLPGGRVADPVGQGSTRQRALRGGAWHNEGVFCRSGFRYLIGPVFRAFSSGLRPVIAAPL